MSRVSNYASLVRLSHTVFAMPFAIICYVYAMHSTGTPFEWMLLLKIVLAMVFARNTAMGFNRYADRFIDARNLRTQSREIPSGVISPRSALIFVIINAALFILVAGWINRLALALSPLALFIIVSYSFTKRFTSWCHVILGIALGIAPIGAYIAVTGAIALYPMLMAVMVITWVAGFDIIYSLQDADFDRENGLHSVPARWGVIGSLWISALLHVVSAYVVFALGVLYNGGMLYWVGAAVFVGLLVFQHLLVTPSKLSNIGVAFGTLNGIASIVYALFVIADMVGAW